MRMQRGIFHVAGESLLRHVAKRKKSDREHQIEDGVVELFESVEIRSYREFRTSLVFMWRLFRWFFWVFFVLPTLFFFSVQIVNLALEPISIVSNYFQTFAWVHLLLLFIGSFLFILALVSRGPAKYTKLRPGDELMQERYGTSQIYVNRFTVSGIVYFGWESVAQVCKTAERDIVVEYKQSEQWSKWLKEYVGVRLRFQSNADRNHFYELALVHLENIEENLAQQAEKLVQEEEKLKKKFSKKRLIYDIMYGQGASRPRDMNN